MTGSLYFREQIYNEDTEARGGFGFTAGRKFNDQWTGYVRFRIEDVAIHDVAAAAPPDYQNVIGEHLLIGFRLGLTRDVRNSFMRPTEGSLLDISFEEVTGDYTFPIVNLDYNKYWTVYKRADGSGRHVLAWHSQVAWAGSDAPVYERFYDGGNRSLRGFAFRGVGPDINGYKVGGDFMINNSLEYQIPLKANDQIYAVAFIDSGTVESQMEIKDYRVTAGVGLRFVVPMLGPVPIALDFGFPIVRGPHDNEQVFSFWLGFFR